MKENNLSIGDFCKLSEENSIACPDGYRNYEIIGFFKYERVKYVIIYGSDYSPHNGVWNLSPVTDHNGKHISIDRRVYYENKFHFILYEHIIPVKDEYKLSNTKIRYIISN